MDIVDDVGGDIVEDAGIDVRIADVAVVAAADKVGEGVEGTGTTEQRAIKQDQKSLRNTSSSHATPRMGDRQRALAPPNHTL